MAMQVVANTLELQGIFEDIFPEPFMQKYTKFESFTIFQYSSAVFVNWNAAHLIYDSEKLDGFVKESTDFESWDDMVKTATNEIYHH